LYAPIFLPDKLFLMLGNLRDHFLLEEETVFLNHGSFGACPRPVFNAYQAWQLQLERQPVRFFVKELWPALEVARRAVEAYVGAERNCIVPVMNATVGVNTIIQSLKLEPGDEILSNDHEYGACIRAWNKVCARTGAVIISAPIPDPIESQEQLAEAIWSQVTDRTKVLFISHITSPSGIIFPAEELCRRARERGILSVVDGAHCAGQIPLDLKTFGADFYTGNCHKWLCAPKGAAFLYAAPDKKHLIVPLMVSWGGTNECSSDDVFVNELQYQGTNDMSAFLTISDAIQFQKDHDWDSIRSECQIKIAWIKDELESLPSVRAWYPTSNKLHKQMAAVILQNKDGQKVKDYLEREYKIEIPVWSRGNDAVLRVSVQGYNTQDELDLLVSAIRKLG
jgi:isopenicillin-N epimerase